MKLYFKKIKKKKEPVIFRYEVLKKNFSFIMNSYYTKNWRKPIKAPGMFYNRTKKRPSRKNQILRRGG